MGKDLVISFDGTWNKREVTQDKNSNIVKLHDMIKLPQDQKFYDSGVGTNWYDKVSGGVFALGLDYNILQGYEFLIDNFSTGDRVFLFGFSRGAYTARSLVGLIRKSGLLRQELFKGDVDRIKRIRDAYNLYRRRGDTVDSKVAKNFREKNSMDIGIEFLGVFDTVGSLGVPGSVNALAKSFSLAKIPNWTARIQEKYRFHDTELSSIVRKAYHAMSIDERRADFQLTAWKELPKLDQVLEQVWFAGVHSDIGGGYPQTGLSDLTLKWMAKKAQEAGLPIENVPAGSIPGAGYPHDSFRGFYKALGSSERLVNGPIHRSSLDFRNNLAANYRPVNVRANLWDDIVD